MDPTAAALLHHADRKCVERGRRVSLNSLLYLLFARDLGGRCGRSELQPRRSSIHRRDKTSERLHSALTSCSFTSIQVHSPIVKLWRCSVDLNLAEFWSFLISHWITSKRFVYQSRQMSRSHMPQGVTPTSTFTNLSSPTRNPDRSRLLVGWLRMLKLQSRFVKLYFSFSKRVREREETLQTADNLRVV